MDFILVGERINCILSAINMCRQQIQRYEQLEDVDRLLWLLSDDLDELNEIIFKRGCEDFNQRKLEKIEET